MPGPEEARHTRDTAFGPPSDPINLLEFLRVARTAKRDVLDRIDTEWQAISDEDEQRVQKELTLLDLQEDSDRAVSSDALKGVFIQRYEDYAVKKKENDIIPRSGVEDPQVAKMHRMIEDNALKHWPPSKQSIYYFRKNKRAEENALTSVRLTENGVTSPDRNNEAVISISYHSRTTKPSNRNESWTNNFTMDAVYSFLSSQTLQDVYDMVPCPVKNLPNEKWEGSELIGYEKVGGNDESGGLIIEGYAHGFEGQKWPQQMVEMGSKIGITSTGLPMARVCLRDMHLKTQMPYWLLHRGNCYHCIVVSSIRLINQSDAAIGYPIALHIARQHSPTCHHCGRNPVTLVINGDTRLGESPSRICAACWEIMGSPKGHSASGESIIVVPFMS